LFCSSYLQSTPCSSLDYARHCIAMYPLQLGKCNEEMTNSWVYAAPCYIRLPPCKRGHMRPRALACTIQQVLPMLPRRWHTTHSTQSPVSATMAATGKVSVLEAASERPMEAVKQWPALATRMLPLGLGPLARASLVPGLTRGLGVMGSPGHVDALGLDFLSSHTAPSPATSCR